MLISRGCDLNAGLCSLPLHLACKLGHAQIVQLLLDSGAKADLPRRVCYPVTHHLKASAGGKPAKFQCRVALRVPAQPITYAIPSDRHEVNICEAVCFNNHPRVDPVERRGVMSHPTQSNKMASGVVHLPPCKI